MEPSSTSSSKPAHFFVRPTRAGLIAVVVFAGISVGVHLLPDAAFTEGDSMRLRHRTIQELRIKEQEENPPKLMVFGSSRFIDVSSEELARLSGLNENEVLNISSAGNDFFSIHSVIRRNPKLFENLEVLMIDILPYQIMIYPNFEEQGAFFLRYGSVEQRSHIKAWPGKVQAYSDLVIPTWSKSQNPYFWTTGVQRQSLSNAEIVNSILSRPMNDLPSRRNLTAVMAESAAKGTIHKLTAQLFFPKPNVSDVQLFSLNEIRKLVPETCEIALISLPIAGRSNDFIDSKPVRTESKETLKQVMKDFTLPDFRQYWYPNPEDIGLNENHFKPDDIHFTKEAMSILTRELSTIYKDLN